MYSGRQYWNGGVWLGCCYGETSSSKTGLHTPIHAPKRRSASAGRVSADKQAGAVHIYLTIARPYGGFFCVWQYQMHDRQFVTLKMSNVKYQMPKKQTNLQQS